MGALLISNGARRDLSIDHDRLYLFPDPEGVKTQVSFRPTWVAI
jgi:hypothetical protein